jgi:ATP-binding cassette, subfamily B (MDR/TAP), member 1
VKSLCGEGYEKDRYRNKIQEAMRLSLSYSKFVGLSLGFMMFTMFINYAIAFYYGSVIIENGYQNRIQGRPYTVGDVIVILFSIMIGGMSLG